MPAQGDNNVKAVRLGVLISGSGRTLMNIQRLIEAGQLPAQVAVVVASRRCKGEELARQAGLKTELVPYRKAADLQEYSRRITAALDAAGVDLVVLAGFLSLWHIPPHYLGRVINIHPALLPNFGGHGMYGHFVHEAVLAAGCKVSGCTVHFVTNEYDRGPIILQRTAPVLEGDTPEALADRVFQEELLAMPQAIRLFAEGRLHIEGDVVRVR
ncbi:MAG: phosphoribosylglycinamide formyltransferase [Phycisphaerae bacterium]|jgi:formyltetrahydrofolate-dependent phosphoribosylglycinamide formyltransferase